MREERKNVSVKSKVLKLIGMHEATSDLPSFFQVQLNMLIRFTLSM